MCAVLLQLCLTLWCSRQGYRSRLLCCPPGDLPNPGVEPPSLASPALAGRFFTTSTTWKVPRQLTVALKIIRELHGMAWKMFDSYFLQWFKLHSWCLYSRPIPFSPHTTFPVFLNFSQLMELHRLLCLWVFAHTYIARKTPDPASKILNPHFRLPNFHSSFGLVDFKHIFGHHPY